MKVTGKDLKKNLIFRQCDEKHLEKLAKGCKSFNVGVGEQLFVSIDEVNHFYLIEEGSFIIYADTPLPVKIKLDSGNKYLVALCGDKHAVIGEFSLVRLDLYNATVISIWDSKVIAIPCEAFIKFAEDGHEFRDESRNRTVTTRYGKNLYLNLFEYAVKKILSSRRHKHSIQLRSDTRSSCLAESLCSIAEDLGIAPDGTVIGKLLLKDIQGYISEATDKVVKGKLQTLIDLGLIEFDYKAAEKNRETLRIPDKDTLRDFAKNPNAPEFSLKTENSR